jgi:hypothetical protein
MLRVFLSDPENSAVPAASTTKPMMEMQEGAGTPYRPAATLRSNLIRLGGRAQLSLIDDALMVLIRAFDSIPEHGTFCRHPLRDDVKTARRASSHGC